MSSRTRHQRDGADRLLALATLGLPPRWAVWGTAMRAELAAIAGDADRWRFVRGAAVVAFRRGLGVRVGLPLLAAVVVASAAVLTSRVQLENGGPGVMSVTVPLPALLVLAVSWGAAQSARSFRIGLESGALAVLLCFAGVFATVALEGLVWMERLGIFVLDADPPRSPVGAVDVVLDLFSTGMWVGHLLFWCPWVLFGAALGAWVGSTLGAAAPGRAPG